MLPTFLNVNTDRFFFKLQHSAILYLYFFSLLVLFSVIILLNEATLRLTVSNRNTHLQQQRRITNLVTFKNITL